MLSLIHHSPDRCSLAAKELQGHDRRIVIESHDASDVSRVVATDENRARHSRKRAVKRLFPDSGAIALWGEELPIRGVSGHFSGATHGSFSNSCGNRDRDRPGFRLPRGNISLDHI